MARQTQMITLNEATRTHELYGQVCMAMNVDGNKESIDSWYVAGYVAGWYMRTKNFNHYGTLGLSMQDADVYWLHGYEDGYHDRLGY